MWLLSDDNLALRWNQFTFSVNVECIQHPKAGLIKMLSIRIAAELVHLPRRRVYGGASAWPIVLWVPMACVTATRSLQVGVEY